MISDRYALLFLYRLSFYAASLTSLTTLYFPCKATLYIRERGTAIISLKLGLFLCQLINGQHRQQKCLEN